MLHLHLKQPQIRLSVMCGKTNLIYSPLIVHFHLIAFQFHMYIRRGYLSASSLSAFFIASKQPLLLVSTHVITHVICHVLQPKKKGSCI